MSDETPKPTSTAALPRAAVDTPPAESSPPSPTTWKTGDVVLGGYRVECELGEGAGGMGRVYLLSHPLTGARFAVKRTKRLEEERQRKFLFELLTWADLPPHPNLLPFRFFRTDGNEVFLFADHAEGGSLADWIRQGRLTTLAQILDVAIQFAWGLHVAHSHGTVHQDVKPSNALMTTDGRLMVGDFGLSRSRVVVEEAGEGPANPCVSHGGFMTRAYCSPEQERKEKLTPQTDVWSWGLSILEAFNRKRACKEGPFADRALSDYYHKSRDETAVFMPGWMFKVLLRCFREDPADRWQTMADIIDELRSGWRKEVRGEYPRQLVPVPPLPTGVAEHGRRTTTGTIWHDPVIWLREALEANGQDPTEAEALMPRRGRWRHTYAMADMVALSMAARLFEKSVERGNAAARQRLAVLCCYDRAAVHESLEDRVGALPLYDKAIDLLEQLVEREGRAELADDLAAACVNKAVALRSLGESRSALPFFNRAIDLLERLVEQEGRAEVPKALAKACMNKANALQTLGDGNSSLYFYDRAIGLLRQLVEQGRAELADDLAAAYLNKAAALRSLGKGNSALSLYGIAIEQLGQLVRQGRTELMGDLAKACVNKANALQSLRQFGAALPVYGEAIELLEPLVEQEDRAALADTLANAYVNKANALHVLQEFHDALRLYDKAIVIRERLVEQDGRAELIGDLVHARLYRAETACALGESRESVRPLVQDSVAILRKEIERTGHAYLKQVLHEAENVFRDLL